MEIFKPKKIKKEIISLRLDTKLLEVVDRKAIKYQVSRNEFIRQAIIFAIENME